jgi:hypothetical protein
LSYVAGYCTFNDFSEREYQMERGGQWTLVLWLARIPGSLRRKRTHGFDDYAGAQCFGALCLKNSRWPMCSSSQTLADACNSGG